MPERRQRLLAGAVLDRLPAADQLQGERASRPPARPAPTCTVPAGWPSWPSGPATPVVPIPQVAPVTAAAPRAMASAHSAEITPYRSTSAGRHAQHVDLDRRSRRRRRPRRRRRTHPGRRSARPPAGRRSATRRWPGSPRAPGGQRRRPRRGEHEWCVARGYCSSHGAADRGLRAASATGAPRRWSAPTARSTGSACPASTPRPAWRGCSAPTTTATGSWCPTGELRGRRAATSATSAVARDHLHHRRRRGHPDRPDADRRRPGRPGPQGHRRRGHGADAARVAGPARLRAGPAVGAPTTIDGEEVITAVAARTAWCCAGPGCRSADDHRHNDEFDVAEGDELVFSMTWFPSYAEPTELGPRRPDRGRRSPRTRRGRRGATTTCRTPTSSAARCSRSG